MSLFFIQRKKAPNFMKIRYFCWCVRRGSNPDRRRRRPLWYPIPLRAHFCIVFSSHRRSAAYRLTATNMPRAAFFVCPKRHFSPQQIRFRFSSAVFLRFIPPKKMYGYILLFFTSFLQAFML